jgi:hypothetical protein
VIGRANQFVSGLGSEGQQAVLRPRSAGQKRLPLRRTGIDDDNGPSRHRVPLDASRIPSGSQDCTARWRSAEKLVCCRGIPLLRLAPEYRENIWI